MACGGSATVGSQRFILAESSAFGKLTFWKVEGIGLAYLSERKKIYSFRSMNVFVEERTKISPNIAPRMKYFCFVFIYFYIKI